MERVISTFARENYRASWRYGWFRDNAIRDGGELKTTENRTEVCQYYAFYFGFASPETHPELWRNLRDKLGPTRRIEGTLDDVHPANALMGNVLRIELLSRYNEQAQVVEECVPYWMSMAEKTGTLWGHNDTRASCNHGFASHAAHVLISLGVIPRSLLRTRECRALQARSANESFDTLALDTKSYTHYSNTPPLAAGILYFTTKPPLSAVITLLKEPAALRPFAHFVCFH